MMPAPNQHALVIFAYIALCSCMDWNGPTSTTALQHGYTSVAHVSKKAILRRQTAPLSVCGFESGQARK